MQAELLALDFVRCSCFSLSLSLLSAFPHLFFVCVCLHVCVFLYFCFSFRFKMSPGRRLCCCLFCAKFCVVSLQVAFLHANKILQQHIVESVLCCGRFTVRVNLKAGVSKSWKEPQRFQKCLRMAILVVAQIYMTERKRKPTPTDNPSISFGLELLAYGSTS